MTKGTVKTGWKFARALFELSKPEEFDAIESALLEAADAYASHPEMSALLKNPVVPMSERQAVLADFSALVRPEDKIFKNFLLALFEAGQIALLGTVAEAYGELVARFRKLFAVQISTAFPVTDAERREIAESVRRMIPEQYAAFIEIEWHLDQNLIGGMAIRAGDKVLDGSVRGALARLTQTLG